jgi:hypothetical protein
MEKIRLIAIAGVVSCLAAGAAACSASRDPIGSDTEAYGNAFSGAIFTTDANGSRVDQNIYRDCRDVYLNGGPKGGQPGLPEGNYVFMVTNPSGGPPSELLSTDTYLRRLVHVGANGLVTAYLGTTHTTGTDVNTQAVTVQLWPFSKTPNEGNEYKAWLTPLDKYAPGQGTFGFIHRWSKTDNFKCLPPPPPPPPQPDAGPDCAPDATPDAMPDVTPETPPPPPPCEGEGCDVPT